MKDYTPKHFTREAPATKVDIHNCFYSGTEYINVPVIEAKTIIGENCPKYLIREKLVVVRLIRGVDHYCLTAAGDSWIRQGILRFLALHPERAEDCLQLPIGYTRGRPKIIRRVVPAPIAPARRIIRRNGGQT